MWSARADTSRVSDAMSTSRIGSVWLLPEVGDLTRLSVEELRAGTDLTGRIAAITLPDTLGWFDAPLYGGVFAAPIICATRRGPSRLPDDWTEYAPRLGKPVPSFLAEIGQCGRQMGLLLAGSGGAWELWQLARAGAALPPGQERVELSSTFLGAAVKARGRSRWRRLGGSGDEGPFVLSCRKHSTSPLGPEELARLARRARAEVGGMIVIDSSG